LLKPIFRQAFLNQHRIRYPVRSRHGEDFLLLFEAFVNGARYALHRKPGYLYTSRTSGLSRTVCDYDSMFRHTLELLDDPRIAGDRLVLQRLRERASALRRLSAELDFAKYKGEHDYAAIVRRIVLDGAFCKTVARRLAHRLFQH
jgi:succinoglycan biosynthesis protein ExoO